MKQPKVHAPLVFRLFLSLLTLLTFTTCIRAEPVEFTTLTDPEKALLAEHVFNGLPSDDNIYIRHGYVLSYNPATKTARWVAYHIKPAYLETRSRKGKFASFCDDPDIEGEAWGAYYKGLFTSRGYTRAHLTPYGVTRRDPVEGRERHIVGAFGGKDAGDMGIRKRLDGTSKGSDVIQTGA